MVQFRKSERTYPEPPPVTLLAFFLRYPNPFARHVLSVDVLGRHIDPLTGNLHTQRLILKRGILPKWASRWLPVAGMSGGRGLDAWVLEESVVYVDCGMPRLRCKQGNLNHKKIMHVIEGAEIYGGENGESIHKITAEIRSDFGGRFSALVRGRIEDYAARKFEANSETARKGMALVMHHLRTQQPMPDTAEFYPPPPPDFEEAWPETGVKAKSVLEEPRGWFWSRWRRKGEDM